ncbi:MAG: ABC transporter permease [Anaerolineae bacterium]
MTTSPASALAQPVGGLKPQTEAMWRKTLRRLLRNRGAVIGGVVLLILIFGAVAAPVISPYDPVEMNPPARLQPPSLTHPFGTDNFGRDIFSRVMYGTRISLPMGIIAVAISLVIGLVGGLLSGYYGRWVDGGIMRGVDVMLAFPGLLLALAIVATLGPSLVNAMIAVGIAAAPIYIRVVRANVLSAREHDYVEAARSVGVPEHLIIVRHILPNVSAPVIVLATLGVAGAIITAAALSYLGLGVKPPTPEWGSMLREASNYLRLAPWTTTFPGLAIVIAALAINLLGDGLRDTLDPRMKL